MLKQLHEFVAPPVGKTTISALPPPIDLSTPDDATQEDNSDDERPRKRRRRASESTHSDIEEEQHRGHGKKKPGKGPVKGAKPRVPRTVVRGAHGFIPMATDHDGNQHVEGHLPISAGGTGADETFEEEEGEEDRLTAKRPELDETERKRRTEIKVKEKEREEELVSRLAAGVNPEGGEGAVEIWEGIELVNEPHTTPRKLNTDEQAAKASP